MLLHPGPGRGVCAIFRFIDLRDVGILCGGSEREAGLLQDMLVGKRNLVVRLSRQGAISSEGFVGWFILFPGCGRDFWGYSYAFGGCCDDAAVGFGERQDG